jgi:signal transduction histidine kinase/ligand-binding sensor domain-containing protein
MEFVRFVRIVRRFILVVLLASIPSMLAAPAYALDPSKTLTQYVHRIWQVQQGLPQAWIYAIVQTRDGFLWLGTQTGLVKFDGVRFTTIDDFDGVANLWVTHLMEDDRGALWIGSARAGLIRLDGTNVTRYAQSDGLPAGAIQCLFGDRAGTVWVCTPNGIASITGGKIRVLSTAEGLPSADVRAACPRPDGTLVVSAGTRPQLSTWDGARFVTRVLALPDTAVVQSLLCASDDAVWAGTDEGLIRIEEGREQLLTVASGLADNSILTLTESRDGTVLAGTKNGFSRIRGPEIDSFRPQDGLSQSTVYSLYEDGEGNLWVATKHGLNQFVDGRSIPYTTSEGLPSNNTGPVFQDRHGTMWIGTVGDGLARFDGHRFTVLGMRDGLASDSIAALAEDDRGDLWIGSAAGLNRLRNGRIVGTWTVADGLPANRILALYGDHTGAMWITTTAGPAVFRNGTVKPVTDTRRSKAEPIVTFGEDRHQQIIAVPDGSPELTQADALYRDREGLLWVGTLGRGLRLIDGDKTFSFSVLDGLFDDVIYGITEDDQGRLWMACSKGIFSVNRADLKQFAEGKIQKFVSTPYSPLDALRTVECQPGVQPAVARATDGRLWFSTIRGVLVIDPNHFERRLVTPRVTVEDVVVDGARRRPGELGTLGTGPKNVAFRYTAPSFTAPARIVFRYMLEGLDAGWVDAGARREAFYTNLPAGSFRFRVAACTPDGACNESGVPVAFTIAPRLYQRSGFIALFALAIGLAGAAMYRLRVTHLQQQFNLVLAERGRIARELHDTLIQGFSGITMAMQALVSRLPSSRERETLEEIVADAGQAMREARRSLIGLRRDDSKSDLATAVAQTARQLTDANNVRLKLDIGECRCDLPAEVEDNLVRIAQEAVLNAVKHSGARTLKITLDSTPQSIQLSVNDDGSGFDERQSAPEGHFGLIGMKERAAQIGADFRITSEPGRGTTVSVLMESP